MRHLRWLLPLLLLGLTAGVAQAQDEACTPLKWNPPPDYIDGRPLDPAAITAYRLYVQQPPLPDGTQPGWVEIDVIPVSTLADPAAPRWTPPACEPQTCWLVVAVLDGEESFISNAYCEPRPTGPRVGPPWGLGRGN